MNKEYVIYKLAQEKLPEMNEEQKKRWEEMMRPSFKNPANTDELGKAVDFGKNNIDMDTANKIFKTRKFGESAKHIEESQPKVYKLNKSNDTMNFSTYEKQFRIFKNWKDSLKNK